MLFVIYDVEDMSYLTLLFKKEVGVTPNMFKKQLSNQYFIKQKISTNFIYCKSKP